MKNLLSIVIFIAAFAAGLTTSRAQEVTNTNHTVVRLEVTTGGVPFGSLDIELFDQEKPETVKNFLRYIYRGVYSNLVLHRLVTNFVLQAGHIRVTNVIGTNAFNDYEPAVNFGAITNEYSVGPELSNLFGTIAMARVGGQTNSAAADFFFNLKDNPELDAVDGGFTVFGRVVNTDGPLRGTNLLQHFNTVPIRSAFIADTFETLAELPVNGADFPAPVLADLFTVRASIIAGPHVVPPQHSVVRFSIFTGGFKFGVVDIELFDQEKPETVKNFLLYVHSGVYSNLVLHRAVPNFVLQAGSVRLNNPDTNAAFSAYTPGVNWGPITNEYAVGPALANDYGTIAMARVPGQTNSASGDFFFNLTNNATLNTNDGGFTVFGRVINTFDVGSGTNVLNFFNGLSAGNGIGSAFMFDTFEFLSELPVSTDRAQVLIPDLFTVQAAVIQGATERDTTPPTIQVTAPSETVETTNATFQLAGTAADNGEVAKVLADRQDGLRSIANGKTAWTADVELAPGTNRIIVRSLDYFGNLSTQDVRTIFYKRPRPVVLEVQGKGTVTGVTNGQVLNVGVTYSFVAKPARGYYFNGWRGDAFTNGLTVQFTMTEEGNVVARFSKTLLGLATGRYEGIFFPSTNGPVESAGLISVTVSAKGRYTGRLKPLGANYVVRGVLDASGQSVIFGPLGTNVLVMSLLLASQEGDGLMYGAYGNGHFYSPFTLYRRPTYGRTNGSPYAGRYSFTLSPTTTTNNGVADGSGFGTAVVERSGRIKWSGALADGVAMKQTSYVLKDGRWPFIYKQRKGDGVAGMATFTTNGTFSGNVRWFAPDFLGGTNQVVRLNGSLYTPPSQARLFNWTNGVVRLSGDGLAEPLTSDVTLHEDGSFTVLANTNQIQLTLAETTGLITGSFKHPASNAITKLQGAVLQSSNRAAGFFLGTPRDGALEIKSAP